MGVQASPVRIFEKTTHRLPVIEKQFTVDLRINHVNLSSIQAALAYRRVTAHNLRLS
jgi:hypothetical protein